MSAPDPRILTERRAELVALFETAPIKHLFGMTLTYDEVTGSGTFTVTGLSRKSWCGFGALTIPPVAIESAVASDRGSPS